jgi:flagellar operon protein
MGYRIINGKACPVGDIGGFKGTNNLKGKVKVENSFQEVLNKKLDEKRGFTVSKHASERLKEINFSENDMEKIGNGFKLAEEKGSKNSVMLYKDVAIIASVENKTVITAVEKSRAEENVFTNIDSVVIL